MRPTVAAVGPIAFEGIFLLAGVVTTGAGDTAGGILFVLLFVGVPKEGVWLKNKRARQRINECWKKKLNCICDEYIKKEILQSFARKANVSFSIFQNNERT
ncbi:MAG: hypothetical protein K2W99_07315 [Chthoniobacterales bacterium]|nr:hypothetical protein [Chthoniobacterales bacterium]